MASNVIAYNLIVTETGPLYISCYKDYDSNNIFDLNKTIINFLYSNNVKYTQEYCYRLCHIILRILYWAIWNVIVLYMQSNKHIINCTQDYFTKYDKKQSYELCKDYCPRECESITYTSSFIKEKSTRSS